jgi:DNA replication protein DnaC
MLIKATIERLRAMRLAGLAEAFALQMEDPQMRSLSFEERFSMMVDHQWMARQNNALDRRLKNARLKVRACVEDIDYTKSRGLDRSLIRSLSTSEWVSTHHNLILVGASGVGKTYLACAFAQKAARDGFTVLYCSARRLFRDLAMARADGSLDKLLTRLAHLDVLVVDDWAMSALSDSERRDFLEICDDRYQSHSTILASQIPLNLWHERIGEPTLADSILDRLVHNAYKIELRGPSLRKPQAEPSKKGMASIEPVSIPKPSPSLPAPPL